MYTGRYTIPELVADLRRITAEARDEHEILKRVRPLARRAALSRESWLEFTANAALHQLGSRFSPGEAGASMNVRPITEHCRNT